jgi:hypothetical protein
MVLQKLNLHEGKKIVKGTQFWQRIIHILLMEGFTIRLITSWETDDGIQVILITIDGYTMSVSKDQQKIYFFLDNTVNPQLFAQSG